jgi:hypothetical protein
VKTTKHRRPSPYRIEWTVQGRDGRLRREVRSLDAASIRSEADRWLRLHPGGVVLEIVNGVEREYLRGDLAGEIELGI